MKEYRQKFCGFLARLLHDQERNTPPPSVLARDYKEVQALPRIPDSLQQRQFAWFFEKAFLLLSSRKYASHLTYYSQLLPTGTELSKWSAEHWEVAREAAGLYWEYAIARETQRQRPKPYTPERLMEHLLALSVEKSEPPFDITEKTFSLEEIFRKCPEHLREAEEHDVWETFRLILRVMDTRSQYVELLMQMGLNPSEWAKTGDIEDDIGKPSHSQLKRIKTLISDLHAMHKSAPAASQPSENVFGDEMVPLMQSSWDAVAGVPKYTIEEFCNSELWRTIISRPDPVLEYGPKKKAPDLYDSDDWKASEDSEETEVQEESTETDRSIFLEKAKEADAFTPHEIEFLELLLEKVAVEAAYDIVKENAKDSGQIIFALPAFLEALEAKAMQFREKGEF